MKKLWNTSFMYLVLGMCGGVFFREFTRITNFEGITKLSLVHGHMFTLGMLFFLLLILFEKAFSIVKDKKFSLAYYIYNCGVILTGIMLLIRGLIDTKTLKVTSDAMISGIAGIGHILLGIGLIMIMLVIKRSFMKENK